MGMEQEFRRNTKNLKVLTPAGYEYFSGVSYMGDKPIIRVEINIGQYWLECTHDHRIYIEDDECVEAISLSSGDRVLTSANSVGVVSAIIDTGRVEAVYDLIHVDGGHRFYGNDILISNCEFIAFDETLVDSIFLFNMVTEEVPFKKTGEVRWYHPVEDDVTYVIGLDPSLGTGGDPAAIEVYALPGMVQVAEWKHNKTPIQGQIKVLKQICEYIAHNAPDSEIYWSVENNTIGEAALVVISEVEEENIPGVFLSEPKRKGSTRRHRKGFTTTHSSKLSACAKLKHWVETTRMTVKSPVLLRELKNFVAKGTSYAAKDGETDDLVMALILVVRMILIVSQYDEDLLDDIVDSLDDDEFDGPMPILF